MNKFIYFLVASAILLFATPNESSAAFVPFSEFKIVGSYGAKNWSGPTNSEGLPVFALNQTPYLYIKLPENFIFAKVESNWKAPSGLTIQDNNHFQAFWSGRQLWLSLPNWNSVQTPGVWTVKGSYETCLCKHGKGMASFVVTPEPVSMILYGMGGLPLMAHLIRRRKSMAV